MPRIFVLSLHRRLYFIAMPWGRAGPVGNAVLKSSWKRVSSVSVSCVTLHHVNFVVAFKVDDAGGVLIEEVVGHHQARIVAAQHDVVRPGCPHRTQLTTPTCFRLARSVVSSMPTWPAWNSPKIRRSPLCGVARIWPIPPRHRRFHVRRHGGAIECRDAGARIGIDQRRYGRRTSPRCSRYPCGSLGSIFTSMVPSAGPPSGEFRVDRLGDLALRCSPRCAPMPRRTGPAEPGSVLLGRMKSAVIIRFRSGRAEMPCGLNPSTGGFGPFLEHRHRAEVIADEVQLAVEFGDAARALRR